VGELERDDRATVSEPDPQVLFVRKEEPARRLVGRLIGVDFLEHPQRRIICVQRKNAIVLPVFSERTSASHTCVVRPLWTGRATQVTSPSSAVPRKLLFSSSVV